MRAKVAAMIEARLKQLASSNCLALGRAFSAQLMAGAQPGDPRIEALLLLVVTESTLRGGARWLKSGEELAKDRFRILPGTKPSSLESTRTKEHFSIRGSLLIGDRELHEVELKLDPKQGFWLKASQWGWEREVPRG
jgi:hypothetical protein